MSQPDRMRVAAGFSRGPIPISPSRLLANEIHTFFSIKAGMRYVTCESSLEADAIYWKEGDPSIDWLCEQGMRIDSSIGLRPHYTFDLVTRSGAAEELVEVKPEDALVPSSDGSFKPKDWDQIEAKCGAAGYVCSFVTSGLLAAHEQMIDNWKLLLPFARKAYVCPDQSLLDYLRDGIARKPVPLHALKSVAPRVDETTFVSHAAYLLHRGEVQAELESKPFGWQSILTGLRHG
jgi:hypothetical protein